MSAFVAVGALTAVAAGSVPAEPRCPPGAMTLARFNDTEHPGVGWLACEDFSRPNGGITLVPTPAAAGQHKLKPVHLPKTFEPYAARPDHEYYLGLGKASALAESDHRDVLGQALLSCKHAAAPELGCFSWADVARALPPIRNSGNGGHYDTWEACDGVRTFVGSRQTSTDATFSDFGEDCSHNGFPSPLGELMPGYSVINWTAINTGEPAIASWSKYINFTAVADGLVGAELPVVVLYLPVRRDNPYHQLGRGHRYWTMVAAPVPDNGARREQDVWFKFSQVDCPEAARGISGGYGGGPDCTASSQHWETYWYSRTPGKAEGAWGPEQSATAAGFYANLLQVRRYWDAELDAEKMMTASLPAVGGTNGTWLVQQAVNSIVRAMVVRRETWHPSYGVSPGYGWWGQNGFQDVFTSTATMALEWGALPFARGVIDNQFENYVRHDGLINYRATEVPSCSRFLTLLALYHSYSNDTALLLKHFSKAKALAGWLMHRRALALTLPADDPRHGIPYGDDEADTYSHVGGFSGRTNPGEPLAWRGLQPRRHSLSSAAEMHRGFLEAGRVWERIGAATGRADIAVHSAELLEAAPLLLQSLHASLNRTVHAPTSGGRCWAPEGEIGECGEFRARTYSEMLYSGTLTDQQADDIYRMGLGATNCSGAQGCSGGNRFLQVGSPAGGSMLFTHIPFGLAYGMLVADMVDRFLLHYFASSAHSYTRGTWTTPEETFSDRDTPTIAYASVGQTMAPIYLRWALAFEEPRSQQLWLGKALPREWLTAWAEPVEVQRIPTRYGRVGMRLQLRATKSPAAAASYVVHAAVTLPQGFDAPGGLRVRIRAPLYAGRIAAVTVGGEHWSAFDAEAETVDFTASELTPTMLLKLQEVMVTLKR